VQAPVVLRVADAPPEAVIGLAEAIGVTSLEVKEIRRRLEAGGGVLAFGEPTGADEVGRPGAPFLTGGKPGGVRNGKGTFAALGPLAPEKGGAAAPDPAQLDKSLAAHLGKGRRAASISRVSRCSRARPHRTAVRAPRHARPGPRPGRDALRRAPRRAGRPPRGSSPPTAPTCASR
jgi:hypothetical protein